METDPRWQQLRATFAAELEERVGALGGLLRLVEQGGATQARAEAFDALFRTTHSLKGAARAVELSRVVEWAHALESALATARRSGAPPSYAWVDAARAAIEAFSTLVVADDTTVLPPFPAVLTGEQPASSSAAAATLPETRTLPLQAAQSLTPGGAGVGTAAGTPAAAESVRVAVGKLETLLGEAGELAVTHIRVQQRLRELEDLRQDLYSWRREWRTCRGLRASVRRQAAMAEQAESALPRELSILLRFTEQAEERVQATFRQVEAIAARLRQDVAQLGVVTQGIADEVLAVRLLPVATVFVPFERMVRDLAQAQAKEIRLQLEGSETEIDRKILEQLRDPLLHMVRNAVDHGIESPDERRARGKPRTGTIRLEATHRGGAIEIQVADDGAGLDPARLRESAVARGLLSREQATALTAQAAIDLIFEPGFSTSSTVTETSGRGVGMDVVREHLERLNGRISTASSPGAGTSFTLQVPLTLATTRAILVEQGGQLFAIPTSMVERNHRVRERDLVPIEGKQTVAIEGHPVPIVELADVLEQPRATTEGPGAAQWRPFFVLRQDGRRVAVLADQLIGEQEIVVKPLGWPLRRVRNVGGAAMLGSGQTIAILNTSDMLKTAMQIAGASERPGTLAARAPQRAPRQRYVLVVDDSLPARTVQRSILEVAGYGTAVATDGAEALKVLHSQPIDLVISDVEMPTLDGFALTAEIRRDEKLRQIPVVLVTSLGAREHRERGVSVGADAYIVKGDFDQGQLLDTVGRLLP